MKGGQTMNDSNFGGWIFCFLIIAVIFGWGGAGFGGGNATMAGYATIADVNSIVNNQSLMQGINAVQLSSQNNNYETARLISDQNMMMMNQQNTGLLTAVNGFNTLSGNISGGFASVTQQIANLGYQLDKCCCDIKTTLLENRLEDANTKLNQQYTAISNAEQSAYLLNVMGKWVANPSAVAL